MTQISCNVPPVPVSESNFWEAPPALTVAEMMKISSQIALLREESSTLPKDHVRREKIALEIKELRKKSRNAD